MNAEAAWEAKRAFQQTRILTAVQLAVTSVCNLCCKYCYADQGAFGTSHARRTWTSTRVHA